MKLHARLCRKGSNGNGTVPDLTQAVRALVLVGDLECRVVTSYIAMAPRP
jgi:hypothetical protein